MIHRWVDRPAFDWLVAGLMGVFTFFFVDLVSESVNGSRAILVSLFQGLAAIAITLAGFVLTTITLLVGQLKSKVDTLNAKWKPGSSREIGELMFKPLIFLVLAFASSIAVVVASGQQGIFRTIVIATALGLAAGAFSALCRNVWLISRLVKQ
ncbi:hypothetical protein GCM10027413_22140 [Conyzicola nivalis]|uniref:Uncharacterized protein n=1 Tax=Conyzicola nivalis TaxID=1477021 RepID=A0A916SBY0_9MICO|nr:hypothetical protein [Conyzicola nivalis]GGA93032.1 hypothetical protein GCM10010979_04480 [Conyzicola nivalis]